MKKNFLLDTNILLQNPENIFGFADNNVYICGTTLQELDGKKSAPGEIGYNARRSCKILDKLREEGDLTKGVKLPNGGVLFVEPDGVRQELLPAGYSISVPDNRIISSCLYLNKTILTDNPIILLTNDVSMRVNATICGLKTQGVLNDQVEDSDYTGHTDINVSASFIDELYMEKKLEAKKCQCFADIIPTLVENEFCTLHAGKQSALSVYRNGCFELISGQQLFGNVRPKNELQSYAMWALTNPDIKLVVLKGPAGTAKTFLSLAAGLGQCNMGYKKYKAEYHKVLISRPNAGNSDPAFGFLPGDLDEKMAPLLASYTDNLETLLSGNGEEDEKEVQKQIDDLFQSGTIEICPLYSIRGRSLSNSFIICDEAQNATKQLIRDVVTRAGKNTKVIVAGDKNQVDAPTLDKQNNGLIYCAESMKGHPLVAILEFDKEHCVRSELAELAIERMK